MTAEHRVLWLPTSEFEERDWEYESGGYGVSRNPSGVRVDSDSALQCTVVLACIRVLATSVAGLPLHIYRRLPGGGKEIAREHPLYRVVHSRPNGWQTSFEWREQMMLHLLSHGDAYNEKVYDGPRVKELIPLHPSRMTVERAKTGMLRYDYREEGGKSSGYVQRAIMHVRGMSDDGVTGLNTIELARNAIGLALACELHGASWFGNGARPGLVLTTDNTVSQEYAESLRIQWERMHGGPRRANKTAILQGGLKPVPLGGGNMQESQFLETRRFEVEEICRLFGVPPHLVGDLSRSSFSNIEQQSLDFLTNGLVPWLRRIESAMQRDLLDDDDEYFVEFDTRGSLRADAAGRAAYYNTLSTLGVASVNEIRAWENMNPVEGGDERFVQLNMTTLTKAAAAPEPVPSAVVEEIVVDPAAPSPESVADAEPQVAEVSLNGAQITGLIEIINAVSAGLVTREGAAAMIAAAFPSMPPQQITGIVAGVVVKEVEPATVVTEPAAEVVPDGETGVTA
jgi:HK97 family phage portal protein